MIRRPFAPIVRGSSRLLLGSVIVWWIEEDLGFHFPQMDDLYYKVMINVH